MGILICGLNGSGKSTVGSGLAERIGYRFIDNEDLFFPERDTAYPYAKPESREGVIRSLDTMIAQDRRFVFAAVRGDYGEALAASLEAAVLIEAPREIRLRRIRERSCSRFGSRMLAGGDLYEAENRFFEMAASRGENYVTDWLALVRCPVIRVDGTRPPEENIRYLADLLGQKGRG